MMKKTLVTALLALGLTACAQQDNQAQEDVTLRDAYNACISTAQGSPEKLEACQSVLDVLRKDKSHREFAEKESVRVLDYQNCLTATKTGDSQARKADCDKVWQEIRANN